MKNFSLFGGKENKVEDSSGKCPYSAKSQVPDDIVKEKPEEKIEKKEEVSSDEEDKPRGGCPVMNKSKRFI
jgi:hypothetical protein